MTEHKRLAVIEKALLIAFAGLLIYLVATGALSLSGSARWRRCRDRPAVGRSPHAPTAGNR
ncbi:hypothetical protein ACTJKW_17250, partial [Serratia marcescens]|uniref:hypothetical protein n=1 Tax=Serratia marcescens TaxID=615 RepID=UPI003F82E665